MVLMARFEVQSKYHGCEVVGRFSCSMRLVLGFEIHEIGGSESMLGDLPEGWGVAVVRLAVVAECIHGGGFDEQLGEGRGVQVAMSGESCRNGKQIGGLLEG
ncbi:hypothetical protein NE237_021143 [Protea cynaroides]|uniref:Uncharacterized protein n=1 Tax=Protea cynaroides TaxID=273540 RepID=A0A9Q0K4L2_9MAGN|nr:hypothetical protein NE237_021143 [Protea cynaroides]